MTPTRLSAPRLETDEFFPVTRWSMVMLSGPMNSRQAEAALNSLCKTYRQPVSILFRHWTRDNVKYAPDEWEDLTQAFFADMIKRCAFAKALPEAGRFRAFICTCAQNFFRNDFQKRSAQRRPNLCEGEALEDTTPELPTMNPEIPMRFLRAWLKALKAAAREALRRNENSSASFHPALFEELLPAICYEDKPVASQEQLATKYGLTRTDVAQRLHRWREAFRERMRKEILETVNQDHQEFELEMREMIRLLGERASQGGWDSEDEEPPEAAAAVVRR